MAKSKPRFDAAASITDELVRIIDRGVLPWRRPWTVGGSPVPQRQTGEPYQGINNFLLTMRTLMAGYTSPYWMTLRQANAMEAKVIKGSKSSVVVYYGTTERDRQTKGDDNETETDDAKTIPFLKSYRVFNAGQIEGLDAKFHPEPPVPEAYPERAPIPHMQTFFEAIGAVVSFSGREACYVPALDKIYMTPIELFEDPRNFYAVWGHELGHWTKPRHRLNRSYGDARFGNTAYAREEIVAELCTVFLGQKLGFSAHTLELNAAYLENWLRVLRSDKRAIFKHAADAQRACDYLVAASEAGQEEQAARGGDRRTRRRKRKRALGPGGFPTSGKDRPMHQTDPAEPPAPDAGVIAAQNDAFRRFACLGVAPDQPIQGRLVVTRSLIEAGDGFVAEAVKATGDFDTFAPENDPAGWHDFGAVTIRGETVFWKIDLYEASSDFRYGAEAPDNPETTVRVLTIMMARDW